MSVKNRYVTIYEDVDLDELLGKLDIMVREKAVKAASRKQGAVIAKEYRKRLPRGDKRHNPKAKPLHKTVSTRVREYGSNITFSITGARYPDGAHAHLVESGHDVIVSRGPRFGMAPSSGSAKVPGKKIMAAAIDATEQERRKVFEKTIADVIRKNGG